MKSVGFVITIVLAGCILTGCVSSAEKKARADLQQADALAAKHELTASLRLLDSIMSWNKDDYGIVGEALRRRNTIAKEHHRGVIETSETLLKGIEAQLPALTRDFILIPGEADKPGIYEHKRQTVQSSWNRTFLKIGLNEKGDVWLVSQYYGKAWIDHTSLRIYDNDSYILTDTIGLGHEWNRKVEDLGDRWETITFRDGSDAGAIAFIADNYQKSIKARLTGKTFQYIVLENYDKEAIRKGWELAQLLKERSGLLDSIRLHQAELRKLGV